MNLLILFIMLISVVGVAVFLSWKFKPHLTKTVLFTATSTMFIAGAPFVVDDGGLHDSAVLIKNTEVCGGGIRCEAIFTINVTGEKWLQRNTNIIFTLEDKRGNGLQRAWLNQINYDTGTPIIVNKTREVCDLQTIWNENNQSNSTQCVLVNETYEATEIVWGDKKLDHGINYIHLWTDQKPLYEWVDWHILMKNVPVKVLGVDVKKDFDTHVPGWAVWGDGDLSGNSTNTTDGNYTIVTCAGNCTITFPQETTIELLLVAGGGGGSNAQATNAVGSGGGAGGLIYQNFTVAATTYNLTSGLGGDGAAGDGLANSGNNGSNSVFQNSTNITIAIGGGGAGSFNNAVPYAAFQGGSGGGGGNQISGNTSGANGTDGQGHRGGDAVSYVNNANSAGGSGGGAGGPGGAASAANGGIGGVGLEINITGNLTNYSCGGGGGSGTTGGVAGCSSAGAGASGDNAAGGDATDGFGGGGGGASTQGTGNTQPGGDGGNGVIIMRILTADMSLPANTAPNATAYIVNSTSYQNANLQAWCYQTDDDGDQINTSWVVYENGTNISQGSTGFVDNATNVSVYNFTAQANYEYNLTCTPTDNQSLEGDQASFLTGIFQGLPTPTLCSNVSILQWVSNVSAETINATGQYVTYSEANMTYTNRSACDYTYILNNTAPFSINYTAYTNITTIGLHLLVNGTAINQSINKTFTIQDGDVAKINVTGNASNINISALSYLPTGISWAEEAS